MRGPPVVLTNTLGRPVTNVISERGAVPMTVVNTLGEPVTLVAQGGEPVTLFNANGTLWDYPFSLFSNNEQGAWYDPSDYSTLFQNSTGTTPVTAVEQPVRLMLDRSRGLVLGGELVTINSATLTGSTGFTAITGASCVAGRSYSVSYTCVLSGGTIQGVVGGTALTSTSVSGTFSFIVVATSSVAPQFYSSAGVGSISNYSVRELPGNHALAPNDASRPVLRSRYNLLTYSEQFDNAGWGKVRISATANTHVAPDGTTTADTITANTAGAGATQINQDITFAGARTFSVYAKAGSHDFIQLINAGDAQAFANFNINTGTIGTVGTKTTASIENAGSGWYRCSASFDATIVVNQSHRIYFVPNNVSAQAAAFTSSGTDTILLWGAQLLTAADQSATGGAYQRIAAATDYDTSNPVWRPYLAFDGSDDSLSTSSIDFSGTDEMTVFAGVTKLSDAAFNGGIIVELTASSAANDGAFDLLAPDNVSPRYYVWRSKGTIRRGDFASSAVYAAPVTNVLTGIGDISGDLATLRINGTQIVTDIGDQGSGNYANAALFIGRRNNASLPYNGRLYSLAVLGRTATAPELSAMEAWVAGKTGATLA